MAFATVTAAYSNARAAKTAKPRKPRTPIAVRVGRALARITPKWETLRRVTLVVSGFGLVDYALWMLAEPAGYAAAGVSLLLIDWLAGSDT